jgi:hypothetical protein
MMLHNSASGIFARKQVVARVSKFWFHRNAGKQVVATKKRSIVTYKKKKSQMNY